MAIYNLSDIIENLKDEKEDYEKKLQAWKNFKIVTKKDVYITILLNHEYALLLLPTLSLSSLMQRFVLGILL